MPDAISNTSPVLYLYRIGILEWLPVLFGETWIPLTVFDELREGIRKGYDVPDPNDYPWLRVVNSGLPPSEWLSLDLGAGELGAMALALEHRGRIVLLDDRLARRTAQAAGLTVWGTLKILLEAKSHGLTEKIEPFVTGMSKRGMWISPEVRRRILILADEAE